MDYLLDRSCKRKFFHTHYPTTLFLWFTLYTTIVYLLAGADYLLQVILRGQALDSG